MFRGHTPAQLSAVVEELALELEERYQRAIQEGMTPQAAWRSVRSRIAWDNLADDLRSVLENDRPQAREPEAPSPRAVSNFLHDLQLRMAPALQASRIRRCRGSDSGARYRSEYRHLQRAPRSM